MMDNLFIPRILIIDDLFGRSHRDRRNEERAHLCGNYLLKDITGDEIGKGTPKKIPKPVAQAVFFRGQSPVSSSVGDTVENDLGGTLAVIAEGWNKPPYWSLVLLDLCFYTGMVTEESNQKDLGMPEGRYGDDSPKSYFGLQVLEAINEKFPGLPVVILSSKPREEVSRDFSLRGATAFIPRADENGPKLLQEYLDKYALLPDETGEIIGCSKALLSALTAIRQTASAGDRRNILIRGERGTGKESFARYIHRQRSKERPTPFITVNSSTLTNELFPSLLFGILKGKASTVVADKGLIMAADGGEQFFDEIKDMLPQVQAGILRVLREREIMPVGAKKPIPVDVSFISATNVDIEALSRANIFRPDLLGRLREGEIILPPLRERIDDIPMLVDKFVRDAEKANPGARKRKIEPEVLDKLMRYDWPGNIGELEIYIKNAVRSYPDLEHLVPVHINFPENEVSTEKKYYVSSLAVVPSGSIPPGEASLEPLYQAHPAQITLIAGRFEEKKLSEMLRNVVRYILEALESNKDRRNDEPEYPKTWHAMTGENIKSNACQRNIGNYIFELSDNDIVSLMKQSKVFQQAVFQCGDKVSSARNKRLPGLLQQMGLLENPFVKKEPKKRH
jgi:DNA-binding NtrC family response regulator